MMVDEYRAMKKAKELQEQEREQFEKYMQRKNLS